MSFFSSELATTLPPLVPVATAQLSLPRGLDSGHGYNQSTSHPATSSSIQVATVSTKSIYHRVSKRRQRRINSLHHRSLKVKAEQTVRRGPPLTPLLHGGPGTDEKRMRWTQRGGEANPRQSHRWACAACMARKRFSFPFPASLGYESSFCITRARLMSWTRIQLPSRR